MTRVLFVSNGHGEAAIAERIALELAQIDPQAAADHLALVGDGTFDALHDVGPRRAMPSGGLIAMGNVRNIARDVGSGLIGLTAAQYRFIRKARGTYDAVVAIGDVFALLMSLVAKSPVIFVGTAKSVSVAPYGPLEESVLRRARAVFVRDDATAERLREHGLNVDPAANVIVDLFTAPEDPNAAAAFEGFEPSLALLPGSREAAYGDAAFLLAIVRDLAAEYATLGAVLSVARGLDPQRFVQDARSAGWTVAPLDDPDMPFVLRDGERDVVRAWRGRLGTMFAHAAVAMGQAGTANEAAAAAGVPVVAFERGRDRKTAWYRKRQSGLLGDALVILPGDERAARGVSELIDDRARRERMGAVGRRRMGQPGGARRIAARIAAETAQRER
jgi:uncharacterized protein (TIGR03492 family)